MTGATVASLVAAFGGLTGFATGVRSVFTARAERRRTTAEADERETNTALAPLQAALKAQGELIDDLNERIRELQQQVVDERAEHAARNAAMQDDIATLQRRIQTLLAS